MAGRKRSGLSGEYVVGFTGTDVVVVVTTMDVVSAATGVVTGIVAGFVVGDGLSGGRV